MYQNTGDTWEHIFSEYYVKTINHIHPDGSKEILIINDNNTVSVNSLNDPGYHKLQIQGVDIVETAVNIDHKELDSPFININDIKRYIPENIKIIPMTENALLEIKEARIGIELWRYILSVIVILLILEMIFSNAKKQQ